MPQIGAGGAVVGCTLVRAGPRPPVARTGRSCPFHAGKRAALRGRDSVARSVRRRGQPLPRTTSMSMPMTQNGAQPGDGRELAALLAIGPDARARVRILVVDDEHTLRESCAGVLRHEGYDVTVCSRGQDALDLLKRRAFDVLLVDLYMTQVDGLALLRAALGTNHDTIVIVMTGNPSVESSVEALRQGAFDYLPKPFSASHLQVLIGRAVHTLLVARETREPRCQSGSRPSSCGSFRTVWCAAWAARRPMPSSMCGSSPRPTATQKPPSPRATCGRTSTTACGSYRSTCRRCASDPKTSLCSRTTSCPRTGCAIAARARRYRA